MYVYLLRCENLYKIGYAMDVRKRVSEIQSMVPFHVELVSSHTTSQARKTERLLQMLYSDKVVRGEWYSLTDEDVQKFSELASSLPKLENALDLSLDAKREATKTRIDKIKTANELNVAMVGIKEFQKRLHDSFPVSDNDITIVTKRGIPTYSVVTVSSLEKPNILSSNDEAVVAALSSVDWTRKVVYENKKGVKKDANTD